MSSTSQAEDAIREAFEYAEERGITKAEIDQEATTMRSRLREVLGERAITDDMLLGATIGAWAVHGGADAYTNTGSLDAEGKKTVAAITVMTVCWLATIRQGLAATDFDFEAAFGGAA